MKHFQNDQPGTPLMETLGQLADKVLCPFSKLFHEEVGLNHYDMARMIIHETTGTSDDDEDFLTPPMVFDQAEMRQISPFMLI